MGSKHLAGGGGQSSDVKRGQDADAKAEATRRYF